MKYFIAIFIIAVTICCNNKPSPSKENQADKPDTVVSKLPLLESKNILKKGYIYSIVANGDTSPLKCTFYWRMDGHGVGVTIPFQKKMYYAQQSLELKKIFDVATKDFDMDSLQSFSIGFFEYSGDLALKTGRELIQKFGNKKRPDYKEAMDFLLHSALTNDFNAILMPYGWTITKVNIEKFHMAPAGWMKSELKLSDTSQFPTHYPDGMFYFNVGKL